VESVEGTTCAVRLGPVSLTCSNDPMGRPSGFAYSVRKNGEVVITHHGRQAAILQGVAARSFLSRLAGGDPQALMARATGNYKRGNERA